jgi:hypothetical protein
MRDNLCIIEESGRWEEYGAELLRFNDRHNRAFCLGPTHEEVITNLASQYLNSYKQLPMNFKTRTNFITKLGLNLIKIHRQLLIAIKILTGEIGNYLLVCWS